LAEYQNPTQEPGGDQRLLLIFVFVFIGIAITQFVYSKYAPKPQPKTEETQSAAPAANPPAAVPSSQPASKATTGKTTSAAPVVVQTKQAAGESETVIENGLYRIVFTNKGAQVKSWIIKKQQDENGHPLDLINARAAPLYGYPLSLYTYDVALRDKLNSALYVPSATGSLPAPASVSFEFAEGDLSVTKKFSFDHSYVVKVDVSVTQNGANVAAYPAWPAGFGDQINGPGFAGSRLDYYQSDDGKIIRKSAKSGFISKEWLASGETLKGPFDWVGPVDQYFGALFMPDSPASSAAVVYHNTLPRDSEEKDEAKRKKDVVSVLGAAVGNPSGPTSLRLFAGPKNLEILQGIKAKAKDGGDGPDLEGAVDFGTFGILSKPLFLWLKWTYEHWVHGWGWSIAILTLIINLVLFPLRYPTMVSSLKQMKIAPELKAINRRYEGLKLTDPRQQDKQREIQELNKREEINQLGGCLPMVLQLPFLFAFYSMLGATVELRHSHWLWIHDLSSADPSRFLPILIVITMFIMQKATPMVGVDQQQAQMMQYTMPLFMGFVFWSLPAGLGVYILAGNLIGYLLQMGFNQTPKAREIRAEIARRAERKKKK
jgi:YidC/Oxa1 family membrane protein insertase